MTQAQVSYTDSCPLVLRYPVTGSLESVRLFSDVRERLIVECFTNNGVAGVKFREDEEEVWTPVSRRRSRRRKMGPGRTSGDPVDPVTIPDEATVFFHLVAGTPLLSVRTSWRIRNRLPIAARTRNRLKY